MIMKTNLEERHFINPCEMKLIFDYDPLIKIDFIAMLRRLRSQIVGNHFNSKIIEEESNIQICVMVYDKP